MENTTPTPQQGAGLTLADLEALKSIVEQACARGAFQASEMRAVGNVYDRLTAFLGALASQVPQPSSNPTQGESND